MFKVWMLVALIATMAVPVVAVAQDKEAEHEMPPMGAPPEMKQIAAMEGVYDVEFSHKADPSATEFTTTNGLATIKTVLDGAAQQMNWQGEMMGMQFNGMGLTVYNRETKKWQNTWIDNLGAAIAISEGDMVDGKMIMVGTDMQQGMKVHTRNTTFNITDKGFEWKMEMSMDGENYMTWATAKYTKR